ncbi:MAG: hypothetical protein LBE35_05155 [Clostridiales bacterium]|jgi:DNA-directed RNA polymerase specialized sigma subunit|nr:hypothetical protein [Clostridiales bacterium]
MSDTKKFLGKVFEMDKRVNKLTEQLATLRARQISPAAARLGEGIQKTRNITADEDLLIKILMLEEKIARTKGQLLRHEEQIRLMTLNLPPIQKAVITWRYICRNLWKDIAKKAEMSEMQIMREHNAAIKCMDMENLLHPSSSYIM